MLLTVELAQIFALKNSDETNTESKLLQFVTKMQKIGSSWAIDRVESFEEKIRGGSSYVELPIKNLSVSNAENEKKISVKRIMSASFWPGQLKQCKTKNFAQYTF